MDRTRTRAFRDLSDPKACMVPLYHSSSKRYYLRLLGYIVDLCVCNSWLLYKGDCKALEVPPMPFKNFRLDISSSARNKKGMQSKVTRASLSRQEVPLPSHGQRCEVPRMEKLQDATSLHLPCHVTMRQTCKHCSHKNAIHRSGYSALSKYELATLAAAPGGCEQLQPTPMNTIVQYL
ncbi:hypothetical protein E2C01_053356 [Portunus trituberculatus]|uniref:PiggyBac transposable element-derived protein domain-containing protein n=1 Tax=Portunus trituberculatus TaxID=210409 RepID=A0A5B7GQK0_PORTR|nr:hypothetical protein [Portunus trituberculatus]